MKATKYTVTIKMEILSLDTIPGLVMQAIDQFPNGEEKTNGSLTASDGDHIEWKTESVNIEF